MESKIEIHNDYCTDMDSNDIQAILSQITALVTDAVLRATAKSENPKNMPEKMAKIQEKPESKIYETMYYNRNHNNCMFFTTIHYISLYRISRSGSQSIIDCNHVLRIDAW